VITTSSAGAALLWPRRPTSGTSPLVLRQDDASPLLGADFSADGKLVVTASSIGTADVYRPSEPQDEND
jgi:hypothetical protein